MMLRWIKTTNPKPGAIHAIDGSWFVLQVGVYEERSILTEMGDPAIYKELVWSDVKVETP